MKPRNIIKKYRCTSQTSPPCFSISCVCILGGEFVCASESSKSCVCSLVLPFSSSIDRCDKARQGERESTLFSRLYCIEARECEGPPPTPIPSCLFARSVKQKKSEVHSPTESQDSFRCLFSMTLLTVNSSGVRLGHIMY